MPHFADIESTPIDRGTFEASFDEKKVDDCNITATEVVDEPEEGNHQETLRALKPRQISMIAIGGAIGTGLIIGSGNSLVRSGPGSMLVSYVIMGTTCFGVMLALGEMSTMFPSKKGFAGHGTRFVDPAFGFATALIYLAKYCIVCPNQIIASSLIVRFWTEINGAVFVTIFIAVVFAINCLGIKWFGEIEFWTSLTKIITLTGLILLGLIIDLGGVSGQERLGFRYWTEGRAFKPYKAEGDLGKFLGFVNALVLALFAYMGTELVGVTVGEAMNPRKTVPAAIRKTFYRIVFFYIFGILVVGMIVDSNSTLLAQASKKGTAGGASASPFVVAIQAAGIKVLPNIVNASLLIFTLSAANSDQYIATRTLYGMALDGNAPKIFARCNARGVPWVAFTFTGSFMGLAYLVSDNDSLKIFNYFVNSVTIFGSLIWICILSSHVGFMRGMKAQAIPRSSLPFVAPFQPYLTYFSLSVVVVLSIFKGFDAFMPFDTRTFVTSYVGLPVFILGYTGYKVIRKTRAVSVHTMDLTTGGREFHDVVDDDEEEIRYRSFDWRRKISYNLKNW